MGCQEIMELLDAYALGAADKAEADAVERHVADCVRCWDELNGAQRAAALLALSLPIQQAPDALRERIMATAQREMQPAGSQGAWRGIRRRFRFGWPLAAQAMGLASVAALAFAGFLQVQMNDLRDEKSRLASDLQVASRQMQQTSNVLRVVSANDVKQVSMTAPLQTGASGVYKWSTQSHMGLILCRDLPPLGAGEVYEAWFTTNGQPVSGGTFATSDGTCQYPMDFTVVSQWPEGIGVSREPVNGSQTPTGQWLLYASLTSPTP